MPVKLEQMKNKKIKGIIFDIKRFAIHDGPGIRTTVFFKGCPMNCYWCHNPESIDPGINDGIGRTTSAEQILSEIQKEIIFFDQSGGGVTFSGGEPLMQPQFLLSLLIGCKERDIHTVVDTTGYADYTVLDRIIPYTDLFLYDLKLIDDSDHIKYTGISNRYCLDNLEILAESRKHVIIRFPVIPGITDTQANIERVGELMQSLHGIDEIYLLPFHSTADSKYKRLKLKNRMVGTQPPTPGKMLEIKEIFEKGGLKPELSDFYG